MEIKKRLILKIRKLLLKFLGKRTYKWWHSQDIFNARETKWNSEQQTQRICINVWQTMNCNWWRNGKLYRQLRNDFAEIYNHSHSEGTLYTENEYCLIYRINVYYLWFHSLHSVLLQLYLFVYMLQIQFVPLMRTVGIIEG